MNLQDDGEEASREPPVRSPQRGAAPSRKGKDPRDSRRRHKAPAFTLGPSRAKGRRARMKRQPIKERTELEPTKKLGRRACTRSRMYGGIKKGAVAFVRSPVANQRGAATVHRPTSDYRFSASRLPNPPQKSTKRNHTLWIDVGHPVLESNEVEGPVCLGRATSYYFLASTSNRIGDMEVVNRW